MPTRFRQVDAEQMRKIENELADVLVRYRSNTEAALPVFALVRCARRLLNLYPKKTRDQLARVIVDFLEGRSAPRDDPDAGMLINVN